MLSHKNQPDGGWQPMETAPTEGTVIEAKIQRNPGKHRIKLQGGFVDNNGDDCKCWVYVEGDGCPKCWCDDVCWDLNSDGDKSAQPTHWKPIKEQQQ